MEEMRNSTRQQRGSGERKPPPQHDEPLKCPRCNSTNTKFCYYNNYNDSQPRYLCKACRRYWTQGGSLRIVPVGGGCRKNKRSSSAFVAPNSSSKVVNNSLQHLLLSGAGQPPMVPTIVGSAAMMDFPNVLPTFMSTGGSLEIPDMDYHHHFTKLSFPPLSLSSPPLQLAPGSRTTSSFLDILRGGFLDGNNNNHESNDFYGPTNGNGGGNGMVVPSFGGIGLSGGGIGDLTANSQQNQGRQRVDEGEEGGGGMMGWLSQHGNINGARLQVVGDDGAGRHQQGSNNDSSSASSRDYFHNWNKDNNNGSDGGVAS